MPVRRSSNASPKASTSSPSSSSSGTDLSGPRLLGVAVFVLITFGLFVYLQHDVLNNAEEVMEMNKPPTVQVGIERVVRGGGGGGNAADSLGQVQESLFARQRSSSRMNSAGQSVDVGGFLASSGHDAGGSGSAGSVSSKSTGGFIPRKFRSASAAAMASDESAKSALRAKISKAVPRQPSTPAGKYVEVDLVADEGRDVGNLDRVSSDECAAACDKEPRCHSFSYR